MPDHSQTQAELAIKKLQSFPNVHLRGNPDVIQDYNNTLQTLLDELERLKILSLPADDWQRAPKWATHKAIDEDGAMYWYDQCPIKGANAWWTRRGEGIHPPVMINPVVHQVHWIYAVEERPNHKVDSAIWSDGFPDRPDLTVVHI